VRAWLTVIETASGDGMTTQLVLLQLADARYRRTSCRQSQLPSLSSNHAAFS
jgi:hypothetical protein